jgi:hypothetical protein
MRSLHKVYTMNAQWTGNGPTEYFISDIPERISIQFGIGGLH